MTVVIDTNSAALAAARSMAPRIRAGRDEIERERRLPPPLVETMVDDGLFRLWVPRSAGGAETDVTTLLRVVEEVARADGAAGWNLAIGGIAGAFAAYLPEEVAAQIYGDPRAVGAGSFNARGPALARPVEGGYRVSGRWAFASGCQHATWLGGGCLIYDGDVPRLGASGVPEPQVMLWPSADAEVIDTWHSGGLRGTGSHDIAVTDLFVPAERTFPLLSARPREDGILYRFPLSTLLALPLAAVATGIARAAIDALMDLAAIKAPAGSRTLLRERAPIQIDLARAEAILSAARAFLFETIAEAWDAAASGTAISLAQRMRLRLAATHAVTSAAQAVDLMYTAGGGASVYVDSPLERCFRDVHTVTQHATLASATYEPAGRVLLGLDPGNPRF